MAPGDTLERGKDLAIPLPGGDVARVNPPSGPVAGPQVFSTRHLQGLDDVIGEAEQATGLRFAAYLGDLGQDTRASAEGMLDAFGEDAPYTVLLAISPGQRVVEVVTGTEAALRITDRAARVAVLSVAASCGDGDLAGAFMGGIRILSDHAGPAPQRSIW